MYTVPIVAPDLRHEETIIQAAHALNVLQKTIDNVFQRLDTRIGINSAKVKDLGTRIQIADQRIRSLVGVKKAVQIYAPAKYPTHVLNDSKVTFGPEAIHIQQQIQPAKYDIKSRFESIHADNRHEKLVFFHLSTFNNIASLKGGALPEQIAASRLKLNNNGNTLGAPTQNLRSVSSLLRFNTEEEAYNRQAANEQGGVVRSDNWRRAKMPKNSQQISYQKLIQPAPHSLGNRNQRAQPAGELRYMPKMHEAAPIIDLPLDLPSLDGVAQDIHFVGFDKIKIHRKHENKVNDDMPKEHKESNAAPTAYSSEVINTTTKIIHIPKLENTTSKTSSPSPIPRPPPPPPPPPQPALQTPETPKISATSAETNALPTNGDNTRSALMDAIRQAGGARGGRLRAAAAAPVNCQDVTDNKHKKPMVASSGNLMDDLHNKLLMRRKGIAGSRNQSSIKHRNNVGNSNPVMQRLSALIPPPLSTKHSDNDDDVENGDWE